MQKEKKKKTPPDKDDIEQRKAAKERKRKLRELVEHDQELGLNVTNHTIHKIKSGRNWGWLTGLGEEENV